MSYSNRSGFTLIQALVSIAIMTVAILAFTTFLNQAQRTQKGVQNSVDFDMIKTSLNLVLNTKACDGSIQDSSGQPIKFVLPATLNLGDNLFSNGVRFEIQKITHGSETIIEANKTLNGLNFGNIEISDAIYDGDQSINGSTYKAFITRLLVTATKGKDVLGPKALSFAMSIRVLSRASDGLVDKCGPTNPQGAELLADNGYIEIGGVLLQWGSFTPPGRVVTEGLYPVTFPKSFSGKPYSFICNVVNLATYASSGSDLDCQSGALSNTTGTANINYFDSGDSHATGFRWFAIGPK